MWPGNRISPSLRGYCELFLYCTHKLSISLSQKRCLGVNKNWNGKRHLWLASQWKSHHSGDANWSSLVRTFAAKLQQAHWSWWAHSGSCSSESPLLDPARTLHNPPEASLLGFLLTPTLPFCNRKTWLVLPSTKVGHGKNSNFRASSFPGWPPTGACFYSNVSPSLQAGLVGKSGSYGHTWHGGRSGVAMFAGFTLCIQFYTQTHGSNDRVLNSWLPFSWRTILYCLA
jgi:hypothetical protein